MGSEQLRACCGDCKRYCQENLDEIALGYRVASTPLSLYGTSISRVSLQCSISCLFFLGMTYNFLDLFSGLLTNVKPIMSKRTGYRVLRGADEGRPTQVS